MKKKLKLIRITPIVILWLGALHFLSAQSDYMPMLELTRFRWVNGSLDNFVPRELNYQYDTIIDAQQTKVYQYDHQWPSQDRLVYLREDVQLKKVWRYVPGNEFLMPYEELLYDFSLQPGDTVSLNYEDPDHFVLKYVHHFDTIHLLDGPHRRLVIYRWQEGNSYPPSNGHHYEFDWIEGVGNIYRPLNSQVGQGPAWPYHSPICAWRGTQPVVGDCEVAFIDCDALQLDSVGVSSGTFQIDLSYSEADWPIHAHILVLLNEEGDTLAVSNFSAGTLYPNQSVTQWAWLEHSTQVFNELPDPLKVVVIDQLTGDYCELWYGTTGLANIFEGEQPSAYPNPTSGNFQILLPEDTQIVKCIMVDMQGKKSPAAVSQNDSLLFINSPALAPGIYIIMLLSKNGNQYAVRVVLSN